MPTRIYSYLAQCDIDMLFPEEWAQMEPLLDQYVDARDQTVYGTYLPELRTLSEFQAALDKYRSLTGVLEKDPDNIWCADIRRYGAPCPHCNRPFRTPRAKICMECGHHLPKGHVAGSLLEALNGPT